MQNKYTLTCVAPDGERVVEGHFETIESALDHAHDMGSRWYFYPVAIVTGIGYKHPRIVAVPDGMGNHWLGRSIKTLQKEFANHSQEVCDWINGKSPLCI